MTDPNPPSQFSFDCVPGTDADSGHHGANGIRTQGEQKSGCERGIAHDGGLLGASYKPVEGRVAVMIGDAYHLLTPANAQFLRDAIDVALEMPERAREMAGAGDPGGAA